MRLVSPQPMETLPEQGRVYVEIHQYSGGIDPARFIVEKGVRYIRSDMKEYDERDRWRTKYIAWSHTATTKEPT